MGRPWPRSDPAVAGRWIAWQRTAPCPRRAGLLARSITPNREGHIRIYEQPSADLPWLAMNRDSMAVALIPMLSENFHRSVYGVSSLAFERETIEREHPDIVIDEVVERGMIRVAQLPMQP